MSKYKVSEPSALKFLKANGAVVDENGNVVNDASDYWKKVYEQAEPKVAKYLHADGTIDENPGSGGGADLEDNKEVSITENGTIEILPTEGKDGMKKVTATVNVAGGDVLHGYAWQCEGQDFVTYFAFPSLEGINSENIALNFIINYDHEQDENYSTTLICLDSIGAFIESGSVTEGELYIDFGRYSGTFTRVPQYDVDFPLIIKS